MTSPKTAYTLALIAAAQARISGMQALNQHRLSLGHSIAYAEDDFFCEAVGLEQLAQDVIQQLPTEYESKSKPAVIGIWPESMQPCNDG